MLSYFSSDFRRLIRFTVVLLLALLTLTIVVSAFARILGTIKENKEKALWSKTLEDLDDFPERFPQTAENQCVQNLKKQSRLLGIDLAKDDDGKDLHPTEASQKLFKEIAGEKGILVDYLKDQFEMMKDGVNPPTGTLSTYLATHESTLLSISDLLLESDPPVWQGDITKRGWPEPDVPLPKLLGILWLQRVLMAHALYQMHHGNLREAEQILEASLKLNKSLKARPELLCQLFALKIERLQLGLLRKLEVSSQELVNEIEQHDYRQSLITSFEAEFWIQWQWGTHGEPVPEGWLREIVGIPYLRFCIAEYSREMRREIMLCKKLDLCELDPATFERDPIPPVSQWNALGRAGWINTRSLIGRVAKHNLDRELTMRILRARQNPSAVKGADTSDSCPKAKWMYRVIPGKEISIGYAGRFAYPEERDVDLPFSHSIDLESL